MRRAWTLPALFTAGGVVLAVAIVVEGTPLLAAPVLTLFLAAAVLHSPLVFPRPVTLSEAERLAATDGRPIIHFRAGCQYCLRLRFSLSRRAREAHWVDIWRDPAAAAAVRETNQGNETVPTVVVAGQARTNPDPSWVREKLPVA